MNSDPKTAAQRQREYANEEHQALSKRLKEIRAAQNGGDDPDRA